MPYSYPVAPGIPTQTPSMATSPSRAELERCLAESLLSYAHWIDRNLASIDGDENVVSPVDLERLTARATQAATLVSAADRLFDVFDLLRTRHGAARQRTPEPANGLLPAGWDADAVRLAAVACAVQYDQLESMAALGEALLVADSDATAELYAELDLIGWTRAWVSQAGCALACLESISGLGSAESGAVDRWRMMAALAFEPVEPLHEEPID